MSTGTWLTSSLPKLRLAYPKTRTHKKRPHIGCTNALGIVGRVYILFSSAGWPFDTLPLFLYPLARSGLWSYLAMHSTTRLVSSLSRTRARPTPCKQDSSAGLLRVVRWSSSHAQGYKQSVAYDTHGVPKLKKTVEDIKVQRWSGLNFRGQKLTNNIL
jgi:hypothetical protein